MANQAGVNQQAELIGLLYAGGAGLDLETQSGVRIGRRLGVNDGDQVPAGAGGESLERLQHHGVGTDLADMLRHFLGTHEARAENGVAAVQDRMGRRRE